MKYEILRGHNTSLNSELDLTQDFLPSKEKLTHLSYCFIQAQHNNKKILRNCPELLSSSQGAYLAMSIPEEVISIFNSLLDEKVPESDYKEVASQAALTYSKMLEVASVISIYR